MKIAITVSQVPEACGGPFVLCTPLAEAFATVAAIGLDAVELFLPGPDFVPVGEVRMNIEERDIPAAIREAGPRIGHIHFADSNRQAMGSGHTDLIRVIAALREIRYSGYVSAEILPLPDPESAARQMISSIRPLF